MYIYIHPYTVVFYMYSSVHKVAPYKFRSWGSLVDQKTLKIQNTEIYNVFFGAVVHFLTGLKVTSLYTTLRSPTGFQQ